MPAIDPFTAIATGIEAQLRTKFLATKWDFHIVPDPLSLAEFNAIVVKTPLLALSWRQLNPPASPGRAFTGDLGMRLTVVVKNSGPRSLRFLGDARGPGLFPAMAGVIALLNGHTIADLGTIFVGACAQAYADGYGDQNAAIATIDLTMRVAFGDIHGDLEATDDFLSMVSAFEPAQQGDPDEPFDVRPA